MSKKIHQEILKLRLSQHIIHELIKRNKLKIFPHMAFGLEVMPVALKQIFEKGDKLLLTHRNIAYNLSFSDNNLKLILDELNLKNSGVSNGILGSMNMENKKQGIIYSSSILGNNLSVSSGVALSSELLSKKKNITYVVTGDGAIEEGSFYETLLLAKYLKLRLIIIIENNDFSMASKILERRGSIDIKSFSKSLGINYMLLNTSNVEKQYKDLIKIKKKLKKKSQPFIIETKVKMLMLTMVLHKKIVLVANI